MIRRLTLRLLPAVLVALGSALATRLAVAGDAPTGVAVVELFTSEGCSSCPPAEAALAAELRTRAGQPVYALAFHVDYWDGQGWPDRFASAAYTDRQRAYATFMKLDSVYTPQAVVNGTREFVGSRAGELKAAIDEALRAPAVPIRATARADGRDARVTVGASALPAGTLIHVAAVQRQVSSAVRRGENSGRTLEHAQVVRCFATVARGDANEPTLALTLPADVTAADVSFVVFAQRPADLRVLAAAVADVP